jgi:dynein light intermediate chain 1
MKDAFTLLLLLHLHILVGMDVSRPSSPEAPPQDLWSSILDSVSTSRSIPAKQVVILGQPLSGKSTIAAALLQKAPSEESKPEERHDFALGYEWADVRDDADEGSFGFSVINVLLRED